MLEGRAGGSDEDDCWRTDCSRDLGKVDKRRRREEEVEIKLLGLVIIGCCDPFTSLMTSSLRCLPLLRPGDRLIEVSR